MISKELLFLVLFCFLAYLKNTGAGDCPLVDVIYKLTPMKRQINFIDNAMKICFLQQISIIHAKTSEVKLNEADCENYRKQIIKLWRHMDVKLYRDEMFMDQFIGFYNEMRRCDGEERVKIGNVYTKAFRSNSSTIIMKRFNSELDYEQFIEETMKFQDKCENLINKLSSDKFVEWFSTELKSLNEDIVFNKISAISTQYRMISDLIAPDVINENTTFSDENGTVIEFKNERSGRLEVCKQVSFDLVPSSDIDNQVVSFFRKFICGLFTEYLKQSVRVYNDFIEAIKKIDVSAGTSDDDYSFMNAVVQEAIEIMDLFNSFLSYSFDYEKDRKNTYNVNKETTNGSTEAESFLNQVVGEIMRIHKEFKEYLVHFITTVGDSNIEDDILKNSEIVEENPIFEFLFSKTYDESQKESYPTYEQSTTSINYADLYVEDNFISQNHSNGFQNYPTKFTDEIKQIICFRSILTFLVNSLSGLNHKTTYLVVSYDKKNQLEKVLPKYIPKREI